jgi:hypothetical protein
MPDLHDDFDAKGMTVVFVGVFIYGAFFAYMMTGIPAFITGLVLYSFDCVPLIRLLLAPGVGFGTMFSWWLMWRDVSDHEVSSALVLWLFRADALNENLCAALLLGVLAAASSTILVIMRRRVTI